MRTKFDEQLQLLNTKLIRMGALCEDAISAAAGALQTGNAEMAQKAITLEAENNAMERDIESLCLKLLLQQQPVARDLRQISAALKMITDMERIGDQAEDIAEIIQYMKTWDVADCRQIGQMAAEITAMVTAGVDAFVKKDLSLAERVIAHDDLVDELFDEVKDALIALIDERPQDGAYALDLLMIAKYFERIGDHAVNLAEWVIFSVTGTHNSET